MEGSVTQLGLNNYLINRKGDSVSFFKHGYQNYSNFVKDTRKINIGHAGKDKSITYAMVAKAISALGLLTNRPLIHFSGGCKETGYT